MERAEQHSAAQTPSRARQAVAAMVKRLVIRAYFMRLVSFDRACRLLHRLGVREA